MENKQQIDFIPVARRGTMGPTEEDMPARETYESEKHEKNKKRGLFAVIAAVAAGVVITGVSVFAFEKQKSKMLAAQQAENIQRSEFLQNNNIGVDDINFTSKSMKFEVGDTEYELITNAVDVDGKGPEGFDSGISAMNITSKDENGKTMTMKVKFEDENGDKDDLPIDEALARVGIK